MEDKPFSDNSYKQFLNKDKLMGSRCKKCRTLSLPPRPICRKCRSFEMEWVEMAKNGKLVAFTCISIGPPFMIAEGYDRKNPYCSGVIELEEGVRVDSRIVGVNANNPESIKVGMSLTVHFKHKGAGRGQKTYLAFKPL